MRGPGVIHCLRHPSTVLGAVSDDWLECGTCARRYSVLAGIPVVTEDVRLVEAGRRIAPNIIALAPGMPVDLPCPLPRFERTGYAAALPEIVDLLCHVVVGGSKGVAKALLGRPRRADWTSIDYSVELAQCGDDGRQMYLGLDEEGPFFWNAWHARVAMVDEIAAFAPGGLRRVCEIGCGVGLVLTTLLQTHSERFHDVGVWATDLSLSRAHITAARLAKLHSTWTVWNGDAAALPFPDDFFDLIWSVHVLEQMASDHAERAFREMLRVSRRVLLLEPLYDAQSLWGKAYIRSMSYSRFVPRLPGDRYAVERSVRRLDFKNDTAVMRITKRPMSPVIMARP